jgi:hypothetical protein
MLYDLELTDGLSESITLLDIGKAILENGLRQAQGNHGHPDTLRVEGGKKLVPTIVKIP